MQRRLITSFGFMLACLAGASPIWAASADMWSERNDYVRLAPANATNQHPVTFSTEQLTILLGQFYKRDQKKVPAPYFSQDEISRLAPQLASQFAKADAGEDVEFGLSFRPGGYAMLPRVLNAGRLFVENGQLNLLIGMCAEEQNIGYKQAFGTSRPLNHGSRAKPVDKLQCALQSGNVATQVDNRPDWVRLDITAALTAKTAAGASGLQTTFGTAAPVPSVPAATQPTPQSAPAATPAPPLGSAEERLMTLKRLHDKGLITDAEYQQKREAILKSL